jgi:Uma2 family endonuclease
MVKVGEYARAGIEEYWIVDTDLREVQVGQLVDGRYDFNVFGLNQVATSRIDATRQLAVSGLFSEQ